MIDDWRFLQRDDDDDYVAFHIETAGGSFRLRDAVHKRYKD